MGAQLSSKSSSGGGRQRRRSYKPMSDINVTPFVDVMLVLLVVFMVTAPLLTSGVAVDLPQSKAQAITSEDNKPLEVTITENRELFIGETPVKPERLTALLSAMTRDNPDRRIFIRADQSLDYGYVIQTLGRLNQAGFSKVALLSTQVQN